MRKFLALTCISFIVGLVGYTFAGVPQVAEDGFCVKYIVALSSTTAVRIAPAYIADTTCTDPVRVKKICIFNEDATATNVSFIASTDTVDDALGWPIPGLTERCYDVGPNFTAWAFREDTRPEAGLKVLYLK